MPLIPSPFLILIEKLILKTYLIDMKSNHEITELRIEAINCLIRLVKIHNIKPKDLEVFYNDI